METVSPLVPSFNAFEQPSNMCQVRHKALQSYQFHSLDSTSGGSVNLDYGLPKSLLPQAVCMLQAMPLTELVIPTGV